MNISQIISNVCLPFLCLLAAVAICCLLAVLRKYVSNLKAAQTNEAIGMYISMACDAVEQAVAHVAQTFVDGLKKDGLFDEDAQADAFDMAYTQVKDILGESTVNILKTIYGDFEEWLCSKIEQACRELKIMDAMSAAPGALLIQHAIEDAMDDAGWEVEYIGKQEDEGHDPATVGQDDQSEGQDPAAEGQNDPPEGQEEVTVGQEPETVGQNPEPEGQDAIEEPQSELE